MKLYRQLLLAGIFAVSAMLSGTTEAKSVEYLQYNPNVLQLPGIQARTLPAGVTVFDAKMIKTPGGFINGMKEMSAKKINAALHEEKGTLKDAIKPEKLNSLKAEGATEQEIQIMQKIIQDTIEYKGNYVNDFNLYELKGDAYEGHHVAYVAAILVSKDYVDRVWSPAAKDLSGGEVKQTEQEYLADTVKLINTQKEIQMKRIDEEVAKGTLDAESAATIKAFAAAYDIVPTSMVVNENTYSSVLASDVGSASFRGSVILDQFSIPVAKTMYFYSTDKGFTILSLVTNDSSFLYWKQQMVNILGLSAGGAK